MGPFSLLMLSVGLAMDATAVAATRGLVAPVLRWRHAVLVALFFGGFQALMPLLGWFLGARVGPLVARWDHWIIFALLAGLGGKMLHESFSSDDGDESATAPSEEALFGVGPLLVLAIATSLDAFAVGVTLPLMDVRLLPAVTTIGVTTACLSALGLFAGRRFGQLLGRRLDAVGGGVLVLLGVKILTQHLSGP